MAEGFLSTLKQKIGYYRGTPASGEDEEEPEEEGQKVNEAMYKELETKIAQLHIEVSGIELEVRTTKFKEDKATEKIRLLMTNPHYTETQIHSLLQQHLSERASHRNMIRMLSARLLDTMGLCDYMQRTLAARVTVDSYNEMIRTCGKYSKQTSESAIRTMAQGTDKLHTQLERNRVGLDMLQENIEQSVGTNMDMSKLDPIGLQQVQSQALQTDTWGINTEAAVQQEMASLMGQWKDERQSFLSTEMAGLHEAPQDLLQPSVPLRIPK